MRRIFKRTLAGFAALLGIAVLLGLVSMTTHTGTGWVLRQVESRAPGALEIGPFEGTMLSGLKVSQLTYRDESIELQASKLDVQVSWPAAVRGKLQFTRLDMDTVLVRSLVPENSSPNPFEIEIAPVDFSLGVDRGLVRQLRTQNFGETDLFESIKVNGLSVKGHDASLDSGAMIVNGVVVSFTGIQVQTQGDVRVRGGLDWELIDTEWAGNGVVDGTLGQLRFEQAVSGPFPMHLDGSMMLLGQIEPRFDVNVSAQQWQVEDLLIEAPGVQILGSLDNYHAEFRFSANRPDLPVMEVSGTGRGNLDLLDELDATVKTESGNAVLSGRLTWAPDVTADFELGFSDIDPAFLNEQLSGNIGGQARLVIHDPENLTVSNLALSGLLNNTAIQANGTVGITGARTSCMKCVLSGGGNRLWLDGFLDTDVLEADVDVDAPALASLWPGLEGQVAGKGRVEGSIALPLFTGDLQATNLSYAGWSSQSITLHSRASTTAVVDLNIEAGQIGFEGSELGGIVLQASGKPESFHIAADWEYQQMSMRTVAQMNSRDGVIHGDLLQATFVEPATGSWQLSEGTSLRFEGQSLELSPHEWSSEAGKMQISRFALQAGDLEIGADITALPLDLINPFLPPEYRLAGSVTSRIDLGRRAGTWVGIIDWKQHNTVVTVTEENGERSTISIPVADADIKLADGGAKLSASIEIDPEVSGQLDLELDQISNQASIKGEMQLSGSQWSWVSALVPEVDNFEGAVSANFKASGPLLEPQLSGDLKWRNGSVVIPALNVPIRDISLDMMGAPGGAATIEATATSGGQPLGISGRIDDLFQDQRSIELLFTGDGAELMSWPEYRVWASPDVQITGDAAGWQITGRSDIPRADINIKELPVGAVNPSADVRIVGEERAVYVATPYSGELDLTLGDAVRFNAFGLETRLGGNLKVKMYQDRPSTAEGQVTLLDGVFEAYGRKLNIEQGTLTFTGALDNPLVDVRAVRLIDGVSSNVKAGIHLLGRAQSLSSTIYAEPAMAEADALSYLVFGRPLSQATIAEGNELSGAAIALGLGQANRITEQVGRSLGLDQLTLTGDGGESTALVAGKQINNRLYARFAYGVFSRVGTYLLRYQLSRRLTLEAATGEAQTIDLLYTVEKP